VVTARGRPVSQARLLRVAKQAGQPQAAANAQAIEAEFASEAKQIVAESAFFAGAHRLSLRPPPQAGALRVRFSTSSGKNAPKNTAQCSIFCRFIS
jgi:hypothetical protein